MCDRDKRQKNLMVIFNRSCCKIEDDLGIWCRGIQLEIRKNDRGGQLDDFPTDRLILCIARLTVVCCGFLKRERTEDARPARERKGASLHLTNNAKRVQAQPALTENVMEICIN